MISEVDAESRNGFTSGLPIHPGQAHQSSANRRISPQFKEGIRIRQRNWPAKGRMTGVRITLFRPGLLLGGCRMSRLIQVVERAVH